MADCPSFFPIGVFHGNAKYAYDVPRQGILAGENPGIIQLNDDSRLAGALDGLEGFGYIWVLFLFDRNFGCWHAKVRPPRHTLQKIGVFATRSPHRPNPIGLSCLRLVCVEKNCLHVSGHDLLDGTPILDIKPYLPYADSFPDATIGWTALPDAQFSVEFTPRALQQLEFLEGRGVHCIRQFLRQHLSSEPLSRKRHRLTEVTENGGILAYRTWRAYFTCDTHSSAVLVQKIASGYLQEELIEGAEDKYADKALHRDFIKNPWIGMSPG